MRTARSLTAGDVHVQGVCMPRGCACPGGVHAQGCACPGGVHAGGHAMHAPPRTEFLTHACENITFPQLLLRAVKILQFRINYVK